MMDIGADAEAEFGGLSLSSAYRAAGGRVFVTLREPLTRNFGCIEVQLFLGVIDA